MGVTGSGKGMGQPAGVWVNVTLRKFNDLFFALRVGILYMRSERLL
jgi:hypothetical protein